MAPPRRVCPRILTAGWSLTRPVGGFVAADRVFLSRPLMLIAPTERARGRCLIHRRPPTTLRPRWLAGAGATMGHLVTLRGGMGLCPTRCSRSMGTAAPVGCSASAPLGRVWTGVSCWLALVTHLGATLRPLRTGGALAPRRVPSGLPVGFRISVMRPMALSLLPIGVSSRAASMRPSTRCDGCVRAIPPG